MSPLHSANADENAMHRIQQNTGTRPVSHPALPLEIQSARELRGAPTAGPRGGRGQESRWVQSDTEQKKIV